MEQLGYTGRIWMLDLLLGLPNRKLVAEQSRNCGKTFLKTRQPVRQNCITEDTAYTEKPGIILPF